VPQFTLFTRGHNPSPIGKEVAGLVYTHRPPLMEVAAAGARAAGTVQHRERVIGGHAILTLAARPPGAKQLLTDYVHLRIHGTNPSQDEREAFLGHLLSGRDENILNAVKGILIQESGSIQFLKGHQIGESYHKVHFAWPADPKNFPYASFDFGVGLTQETHFLKDGKPLQYWTRTAWDWQENLRTGFDEFFDKMRHCHRVGDTWHSWMMRAWHNYNGGGQAAVDYAQSVSRNEFGRLVSGAAVPSDWRTQAAPLPTVEDAPEAPSWPPADMNAPADPSQSPNPARTNQTARPPAAQPPPQEPPPREAPPQDEAAATQSYIVKKGDTLSGIAAKFKVSLDDLAKANNISNPDLIRVGQTLTIP